MKNSNQTVSTLYLQSQDLSQGAGAELTPDSKIMLISKTYFVEMKYVQSLKISTFLKVIYTIHRENVSFSLTLKKVKVPLI